MSYGEIIKSEGLTLFKGRTEIVLEQLLPSWIHLPSLKTLAGIEDLIDFAGQNDIRQITAEVKVEDNHLLSHLGRYGFSILTPSEIKSYMRSRNPSKYFLRGDRIDSPTGNAYLLGIKLGDLEKLTFR